MTDDKEQKGEWAIPSEACGYVVGEPVQDDGGEPYTVCDHKDNKYATCSKEDCPIKVTPQKDTAAPGGSLVHVG